MSTRAASKRTFTEEHRARISAAKTGKKRPPLTPEWRAKIGAAKRGKRLPPEHRASIRLAQRTRFGGVSRRRSGRRLPTYSSWIGMIERCTNPSAAGFKDYGGRGIAVCAHWNVPRGRGRMNVGYLNFLSDMGERPAGTTIDRINNDGNYEPGNCRWATWGEQASNRRVRVAANTGYVGSTVLSEQMVREARALYQPGVRGSGVWALAKRFGVHRTTMRDVLRGKSWKHVQSVEVTRRVL